MSEDDFNVACKVPVPEWLPSAYRIHAQFAEAIRNAPPERLEQYFLVLSLGGECGELQNLYKKEWRGDDVKDLLSKKIKEVADNIILLMMIAGKDGIDVDKAAKDKLVELHERWGYDLDSINDPIFGKINPCS